MVAVIGECAQEGALVLVLTPTAANEQKQRGIGAAQEIAKQQRAIDVAPLQIIHDNDQRPPITQTRDQVTQPGNGPAPQFMWSLSGNGRRRRVGKGPYGQEHRKDAREWCRVAWEEGRGVLRP
jgi:hypothetical protein